MKLIKITILTLLFFAPQVFAQTDGEDQGAASPGAKKTEAPSNYEKIADDTRFYNGYHFYEMKMYPKASVLLSEYVEVYSNGIHRKEAIMALGNIEFTKRNYSRAADFYTMLFEEFSADEEGVEAYYRAAICYQKMGFTDRSERIFTEIVERYPQSRLAESAKMQRNLDGFMKSSPQAPAAPVQPAPALKAPPAPVEQPTIKIAPDGEQKSAEQKDQGGADGGNTLTQ